MRVIRPTFKTLRAAIEAYHDEPGGLESQVMHQLNSFLVTEPNKNYIETGTIFARKDDAELKHIYICVTPACDLVPRQPKDYLWETNSPFPSDYCHPRPCEKWSRRRLPLDAEQNKHLFIMVDDKPMTIVLMDSSVPVPVLEWFVWREWARSRTWNSRHWSSCGSRTSPKMRTIRQQARENARPRQVRAIYASKFQQYAGQHLSRIGVDFREFAQARKEGKARTCTQGGTWHPASAERRGPSHHPI